MDEFFRTWRVGKKEKKMTKEYVHPEIDSEEVLVEIINGFRAVSKKDPKENVKGTFQKVGHDLEEIASYIIMCRKVALENEYYDDEEDREELLLSLKKIM